MEPKSESISRGKIAAFIIGGIFVVIFLALIFNNNSSPSNPNAQSTSTATTISGNQNSNSQNQTPPPQVAQNNNLQPSNSSQITSSDIAPYLTGVVEVLCRKMDSNGVDEINDTGSGSLWSFPNSTYDVVTNEHVIAGDDDCVLWIPNPNKTSQGTYYLDLSNVRNWNSIADEAVIPIMSPAEAAAHNLKIAGANDIPMSQLNYNVSSLRDCPSTMPSNSPVTVVGYPAFSSINVLDNPDGAFKNQITTNGVISGDYTTYQSDGLPDVDYYISATIDSGNSGGIAFSKDANGLCLLGIPTWITLTGNFTNEGIVQNIYNVKYAQ
jgi:hypothetical protein